MPPKRRGRPRKGEAASAEEYKEEIERLKMERVTAGFSLAHRKEVRPRFKYQVICQHRDKYSVSVMCRFFGVFRSGYYDSVKRLGQPEKDADLAEKIRACRNAQIWPMATGEYGCVWRAEKFHRNSKTVLRIMKKYGLLSKIRRRRKWMNLGQQAHKYQNLLNRQFHADKPNRKWVTDISYIHMKEGALYLSVIHNLYDNSIVAYKTAAHQTVNLVPDTVRLAMKKEKKAAAAELQLHSDQGFQYTSHGYFKLTQEYGITPPMSRKGNPYDNAMAENFFSILKTECIYRHKPRSLSEAQRMIDNYICFYNFITKSASKRKLEWRRSRCATPPKI